MEVLGLHAKEVKGDSEVAADTRRVLGGLQQIGLGINGLRNEHGTGHGHVRWHQINSETCTTCRRISGGFGNRHGRYIRRPRKHRG